MPFRPLLAAAALLSMVPVTSFAAVQCAQICDARPCDQRCHDGLIPTTCRGAGYCDEGAGAEQEAGQSEETELVCTEAHPESEQSATAES
jgi:hypothetical protein